MKKLFLLLASLAISVNVFSQAKPVPNKRGVMAPVPVVKRALTHKDYDGWKSISQRAITANGAWATYVVSPQEGDNYAMFQSLKDSRQQRAERVSELRLTPDSEWAMYKVKPTAETVKKARRAKKKKEDMPKDSLGMYSFVTNTFTILPFVQSYKIPEKGNGWVAYLKDIAPKDTSKKETARGRKAPKKESEENGYTLAIRSLKNNAERQFAFVTDYEFAKNGKYVAFTTTGDSLTQGGVYVYDPEKGTTQMVFAGRNKQKFKKLTFDEAGTQLVFVADLDSNAKTQIRKPKLYYWKTGQNQANLLADETNNPAQQGWYVSADYTPNFAKDGSKLFFGTNPKLVVPDTTLLADEIVNVEVWNYKDKRLQTQQKVTLEQDKKRSYLAAIDLESRQMAQIGTPEIPNIELVNEGRADWVLATTNLPYSNQHWDWNNKEDAYLLNISTGTKALIKKKIEGNAQVSPNGRYVYWFSNPDTSWFAYNVASRQTLRLTNNSIVKFADEDDDHPDYPQAYGVAGWTKNDAELLIYDKYDVWAINPDMGGMTNLTQTGRTQKKTYRYVRLDPEERNIDTASPLLMRTFDHTTKGSGYALLNAKDRQLSDCLTGDFEVSTAVVKAKNTNDMLFSKSSFKEFPEVWHSDLTFKNMRKLSNVGAQMDSIKWGSVELVNYKATDGTPLQGLLYKPEDFDATKKYPMLVYFYEKYSDDLHSYVTPRPSSSAVPNFSYAVSNGYVVFVPDIVYQIGYPGRSAFNCIMPGVLSVTDKGYIDRERLGVVGHSWGGYQAAYLITQTNFFKAAVPGAPVANMTSAYSGIRWGSGMARQAQYEQTQSRIGGTLWQKPMQYIDNSPLFHLDKVNTPSLILHNDEDDAVPWYQGIELFMGLKRLNKPTWMLVYNGEKHGNRQRKNQQDFSVRMWQFLDYYLKGAPAPSWMSEGLPMVEKGINQHLEVGGK